MTHITVIAPQSAFDDSVTQRRITCIGHASNEVPYVIYNYSKLTPYQKDWDVVTLSSRGLIVNTETGEIVARPFAKFFNDNENIEGVNDFARTGPVVVTEKADGSLGVLYRLPDGEYAVSTRGSMNSSIATEATRIYNEKYAGTWTPDDNYTYLFEIIFPANRIVLNYGREEILVLLGAVNKATGRSLTVEEARTSSGWVGPVTQTHSANTYEEALSLEIEKGREGVVIHFIDSDNRVKLKGEDYLRLHGIMTGATPLRIWEFIMNDESLEDFKGSQIPEEFTEKICAIENIINNRVNTVMDIARKYVDDNVDLSERRDVIVAKIKADKSVSFDDVMSIINGNEPKFRTQILRRIRPDGGVETDMVKYIDDYKDFL